MLSTNFVKLYLNSVGFLLHRSARKLSCDTFNSVNRCGKVMMMWNADLHPGHLPEELDRRRKVMDYLNSFDGVTAEEVQ